MAQEQFLKLIHEAAEKHDISIWNKWRQEHPDIRPDLSGIELKRADLRQAALHGAILRGSNLRGADLSKADLSGADFHNANLVLSHFDAANLAEADLSGANLCDANLSEANLCEANFSEANLVGALLIGADLKEARLEENVKSLSPSQLKKARNWDHAYLNRSILEALGLSPDHNELLRRATEERKRGNGGEDGSNAQ